MDRIRTDRARLEALENEILSKSNIPDESLHRWAATALKALSLELSQECTELKTVRKMADDPENFLPRLSDLPLLASEPSFAEQTSFNASLVERDSSPSDSVLSAASPFAEEDRWRKVRGWVAEVLAENPNLQHFTLPSESDELFEPNSERQGDPNSDLKSEPKSEPKNDPKSDPKNEPKRAPVLIEIDVSEFRRPRRNMKQSGKRPETQSTVSGASDLQQPLVFRAEQRQNTSLHQTDVPRNLLQNILRSFANISRLTRDELVELFPGEPPIILLSTSTKQLRALYHRHTFEKVYQLLPSPPRLMPEIVTRSFTFSNDFFVESSVPLARAAAVSIKF